MWILLISFFVNANSNNSIGYGFSPNFDANDSEVFIKDYELEPYLRKLKPTAPGLDALPIVGYLPNALMN